MSGIVTVGEAMLTVTARNIGPLRMATDAALSFAGSEATVAIGARRLGNDSCWVSRLGDDEAAALIRTRMHGEGVRVVARTDEARPTGLMLKERRSAETRRVSYYRQNSAASALSPDDLPAGIAEEAAFFHATGITAALSPSAADTVRAGITRANRAGVRVSFDVNHRSRLWPEDVARNTLLPLLPEIDTLFASVEEASLLLGTDAAPSVEVCTALRAFGPSTVVLTDGAHGSWWADGRTAGFQPATEAVTVDPFGAGDVFVAGFLSALLDGADNGEASSFASRAAAVAVATEGDWEGIPERRDVPLPREGSAAQDIAR